MDYSSLSEAQQQQYQQQQYPQQQQQQDQQQQSYDPSQSQAYDAYYAYHQQQQQQQYDASAYHHQNQYYSHDDYAAAAYQTPDPNLAQAHAAGAQPHDSSQIHGYAAPQEQQSRPGYPVPGGLNPAAAAAVAALSQLTQFAGSMEAAERAMAERQWNGKGGASLSHHHQYPQHHPRYHSMEHGARPVRGGRAPNRGARRGGGPIRGGGDGRGNFIHHPPRQDGGAPSRFRGRGRGRMGRGGGRKPYHFNPESQPPHTAPALGVELSAAPQVVQQAQAQRQPPSTKKAPVLPRRPLLPVAWCDICRVDCNSLEILEQHKNGKRHKKTVLRFEEVQKQQKLLAEFQATVMPQVDLQSNEPNKAAQGGEESKASASLEKFLTPAVFPAQVGEETRASPAPKNLLNSVHCVAQVGDADKASAAPESKPTAVTTAVQNTKSEMERSQNIEATEAPTTELPPSGAPLSGEPAVEGSARWPRYDGFDHFDRHDGGPKRKMMRFGRGGKRLKSFEPMRGRVHERPKDQPRVCTLCNVMCDTLAVFECHLSGKKHTSRIRRFQGQGTVYGPITVYIPPNQPSTYPTHGQEPLFYGLKSHEMLQHEVYGEINGLQVETKSEPEQGDQVNQSQEAEGGAPEPQTMTGLERPEGEVIPATGAEDSVVSEAENLDLATKEPAVSPIELMSDPAVMETEVAFPVLEYGTSQSNDVLPGLDAKVEDSSVHIEELAGGAEMSF